MYHKAHHRENLGSYSFLITGGAGFIGSNIVEYLLNYGARKVRVLDNLSTGFYKNLKEFVNIPEFEFVEGDIRDLETCKQACNGIDFVSHHAALGSVPRSINDPITSNEVNVSGFLNMLVAVKESGIQKIVYAASSSTYGDSKILPKVEHQIGAPLSPYAVTKYVNELYADVFAKIYGVKSIGLRYFNVFGPKQNPHGAYAAVIPLFIKAIIENSPATMNGDGSQTRDFTFVDNVVQANIKAFFAEEQVDANVFNVAVGERISLNELWDYLNEMNNTNILAMYGPSRLGDVRDSLADITKIKAHLNYEPEYTVREGLKITLDWFKRIS